MSESDKILNDIRAYLRVTAAAASRPNAAKVIDSSEKADIYARLDGITSQAKLEQTTGVPNQTLSRWLFEFVQEGIASTPNEFYKGYRALFSLQELGINSSSLKKRVKTPPKTGSIPTPSEAQPTVAP